MPASGAIVINEVESQPTDFVELYNTGAAEDISGYTLDDFEVGNGSQDPVTLPGGTNLAAGGHLAVVVDGLGNPDTVRLFDDGAVEIATFEYLDHAVNTWGRCPDGTGAFAGTLSATPNAANDCRVVANSIWPGGSTASVADGLNALPDDTSGLAYQPSGLSARGTVWAVQNSPSMLYKLVWDGTKWINAAGWTTGKQMDYPGPLNGVPDAEGVTFADGDANGLYVATERDGGGASLPAVLRVDTTATAPLKATEMWDLSGHLPGLPANEGPEAITLVPDSLLVAKGFKESNGTVYNPANYPGHGSGLFLLGVEQSGEVVAFALQSGGVAKKIATFPSGFRKIMDLSYEAETKRVWAVCDDNCDGQTPDPRHRPDRAGRRQVRP